VYHLEGIILEGIIQKLVILRVCEFMREAQQTNEAASSVILSEASRRAESKDLARHPFAA
jgi:hypothetical protein